MWLVCNVRSDDTWWSGRWHQQQSTSFFYIFFDGFGDVYRCRINNEYELQWQSSPQPISRDTRPAASQQPAPDTGHLVAQVCPNISPAQITSTVTQTLHCLITNITTLSAQYYLARRVTVSWAVPNICIFSMDRMFYIRDETKTVNLLNRLHAPFMIIFITYYLKVVWYVAASREQCGK